MGFTDFSQYNQVMSNAEKKVRANKELDKIARDTEKEARAQASVIVSLEKQNLLLEKRVAIVEKMKQAGIKLEDAQKRQLNADMIALENNEKEIEQIKEKSSLKAMYEAESLKFAKQKMEIEQEIVKLEEEQEKSENKYDEKKKKELADKIESLKNKKDNVGDYDEFVRNYASKNGQVGGKDNDTKHILAILTGKESNTSGIGGALNRLGTAAENTDTKLGDFSGRALSVLSSIADCAMAAVNAMDKLVDNAAEQLAGFYGVTNAYLEGSSKTADALIDTANDMFGGSALVRQTDYLNDIAQLASRGISFNIEQRALLNTIANKTLPTFSSMEGALLRLVKLKKTDLSQPFFGMEEVLKRSLNRMFEDSSYLQNLYDSVNGILANSSSKQSASNITAYNSTVQS